MPDVPDEAWRRLREIDAWWRALPSPDGADAAQTERIDSIPANTWQEMQDGQATAISEIRANAELMTALRAVAREADDPVELALLYTVLRDAVIDYQTDPAAIAGDPRVDWDARTMETRLSVYLPEGTLLGDSGDSGDSELPALDAADESARELTLIGGTPTRFPGLANPPGSEFLLQFDCAVLRRAAGHEGVARLIRENSLPRQGVLQLFYAAGRDSLTTPEVPGGGTTLRHVSEAAVRRRAPGSAAGGASGWPMVLPSFGASIEASPAHVKSSGSCKSNPTSWRAACSPTRTSTPSSRAIPSPRAFDPLLACFRCRRRASNSRRQSFRVFTPNFRWSSPTTPTFSSSRSRRVTRWATSYATTNVCTSGYAAPM